MKKFILVFFILLIILFSGVLVFKDALANLILTKGIKAFTGLNLETKEFNVGLLNTAVSIAGLKIFNPSGYQDPVMLDIPEVYVNFDLPSLLKKKVHLEELRIYLKELTVIKNKDGQSNIEAIKLTQGELKKETTAPVVRKEKRPALKMPLQIDLLLLKIDKVTYKDYSGAGASPQIIEFKANINQRMRNITDPNKLIAAIMSQALLNTTVSGLSDTIGSVKDIASQAVRRATETPKQIGRQATETAEQAVGKAAESAALAVDEAAEEELKKVLDFGR